MNDELKKVEETVKKPVMEFGIEETKDIVVTLIKLANATKKSLEDNVFTTSDIFNYMGTVTSLPKALTGIKFVPSELGNLNDEEITTLVTMVANDTDYLNDDKLKSLVLKALVIALAIKNMIKEL